LFKSQNISEQDLLDGLTSLNSEYNKVMESSPVVPSWAYKRGKQEVNISLESTVK
jgi:hypothetical protein